MTARVDRDDSIPRIEPVPADAHRPSWSVMIPTYNCTDLLERTLRCVLDQEPGGDRMQIAVVDDRSPNGRSRAIVERLAPGRVEFFEQPANVGLAANWNACIARSRGYWVHILHQDDLVSPGFYERLGRAGEAGPDIGAAFCRFAYIDGQGVRTKLAPIERETAGVLAGWADRIAVEQRVQCPSIVVRREVYERLGGFRDDLRFVLDWEMWARIAFRHAVWYEPEILASWRDHERGESRRLKDAGLVLDDIDRGIEIIAGHAPASGRSAIRREANRLARWWVSVEVERLMGAGRPRPALGLINRSWRYEKPARRVEAALRFSRWALKVWLERPASRPGPRRATMPETPRISVLMPAYNAERYLAEAVESILGQTFTDFEFLIVDDGSTDGTRAILERYAALDGRIRLVSRPNTGYLVALNEMIGMARGDLLARMDSDDVSLPERFEKQVRHLDEHEDCVLVGSRVMVIDPAGRPLAVMGDTADHEGLVAGLLADRGQLIYHPAVMFRKRAVVKVGAYRDEYYLTEDLDLFLRMAEVGRIANLPETLLEYREHLAKVGRSRMAQQILASRKTIEEAHRRRGLEYSPPTDDPGVKPESIADTFRCWGWWALMSGNVASARRHAIGCLVRTPLDLASWKLFLRAIWARRRKSPASIVAGR